MFSQLVEFIQDIALEAEVKRQQLYQTHKKADGSIVTSIDLFLHDEISKYIRTVSDLPIVSEEDIHQNFGPAPQEFWILDPLDGTRHFVDGDGEYAVCLGLIKNGKVVEGIVSAPAFQETYWAQQGAGSYLNGTRIYNQRSERDLVAFSSGYHEKPRGQQLMKLLNIKTITKMGSALKMCRIARGDADLYPRFGETYEWDTAGAQIILEEAGAQLWDVRTLSPLKYGKERYLNKGFIAFRNGIDVITPLQSF